MVDEIDFNALDEAYQGVFLYNRRQEALAEAQKNPNMEKIVANLKKVKTLKSNIPVFNPPESYIIPESSKAIFIHGKKEA